MASARWPNASAGVVYACRRADDRCTLTRRRRRPRPCWSAPPSTRQCGCDSHGERRREEKDPLAEQRPCVGIW
nr:unnamed protein product [Digitaria exilis]